MEPIIGSNDTPGAPGQYVSETTDANFSRDVLEASMSVPVIVDFWAPWCGPCKQLGPMLEKAVNAAGGKVRMVKINIDENQMVAQQLRVQSIPAVYGFAGGRPVDGFMGMVPESQIKTFVDNLVKAGAEQAGPDPVEAALEQAKALEEAGDMDGVLSIYAQVLQHDPENAQAAAGLVQAYLTKGEPDAARQVIDQLSDEVRKDARVTAVIAALDLAEEAGDALANMAGLKDAVAQDPNDHQSRYELAKALFASGEAQDAVDHLFHIFQTERDWNEDAARVELLKFFEALGPTDPVAKAGRRRLSSLMFS